MTNDANGQVFTFKSDTDENDTITVQPHGLHPSLTRVIIRDYRDIALDVSLTPQTARDLAIELIMAAKHAEDAE